MVRDSTCFFSNQSYPSEEYPGIAIEHPNWKLFFGDKKAVVGIYGMREE